MSKTIIAEGRTTNEAIEKGLKELGVSRDRVEIKVWEDEKRSFFNILTPRVVKIEMTLKDDIEQKIDKKSSNKVKKEIHITLENQEKAKKNVEEFLKDFIKNLPEGTNYKVESDESGLNVALFNDKLGFLIGYRGETLDSLQYLVSLIVNKDHNKPYKRVVLDTENYRQKREETLKRVAEKAAYKVKMSKRPYKLEPMNPYERRIIHSALQDDKDVTTYSEGEEPYRRIVIDIKK